MSDHHNTDDSGPAARVKALEALLTEKGLIDPAAIDAIVDTYETRVGPRNGARVVAKAWTDPAYRKRLLADATSAVAELGFAGPEGGHLVAVENTDRVHNLVVCTLCSCYPWPVLGLPPVWYKSFAYRSRAVSDPRGVLEDFGLELPSDVDVRVWDSSAEIRYLVIPQRPKNTARMSEDELAAIARLNGRSREGRGAAKMNAAALNELIEAARLDPDHVFSAPWEARAFAIALQLAESGYFTWDEFRDRLIGEVRASDKIRARDGTSDHGKYYDHFLHALEKLLEEKGLAH
jgi:nitrile hydratase